MPHPQMPIISFCHATFLAAIFLAIDTTHASAEESEFAGLIRGSRPTEKPIYEAPLITRTGTEIIDDRKISPAVQGVNYEATDQSSTANNYPNESTEIMPSITESAVNAPIHSNDLSRRIGHSYGDNEHPNIDSACDAIEPARKSSTRLGNLLYPTSSSDLWFASAELLLMFRSGDKLPILVTTSTDATGQGVLPVGPPSTTRKLFGNERVLDEMTPGGRLTLGVWLDKNHCHSVVFRGWGSEDETFSFGDRSTGAKVIARPFLNTDPSSLGQDSLVVAGLVSGQSGTSGSIAINGRNQIFGGDLGFRHQLLSGLGGVVEFVYGYQQVAMHDELSISSESFPTPSAVRVVDRFEADNRFHGAQIGLATRYREGCWSFNGLLSLAGGSTSRDALRTGLTDLGAGPQPFGLLVGESNSGNAKDNAFGWVPEVNASVGCQLTRNFDLSIGYHLIAMTDSLQASGMIDRDLAVNQNPSSGPKDPSPLIDYDTFHVHGLQFGINFLY